MTQIVEPLTFTVPLSFEAHAVAQQQSPQTQQTYLKALAVYAVEFYLRCLGVETNPDQSDWRNPWIGKFVDVADLWLPSYGKLECCVLLPDAEVLTVSPDAWTERIGYVAVQFAPTLKSATLLGFTPTPVADLPLVQLQSLEHLLTYLQSLATATSDAPIAIRASTAMSFRPTVHLRKWLEGVVEEGWQQIESLLGSGQMVAVRSQGQYEITVRQAKLIDVGVALDGESVVLSLAITLNPDTSMNVLVQTYPAAGNKHLPPNLKLTMLGETGELLQEVCSREQDSYIQLRHFRGEAGDSFDIQVSLNHVCVSESFIL
ncbi:MAG: DUF1822 family protein [Cyanobacteria bacterium RM1_2_2]|nr:DUF1822 family protein [Cyanobacteria bacterium RM1_2_2]